MADTNLIIEYGNVIATGVAAFLGVLSGLIVNILSHGIIRRKNINNMLNGAIFELQFTASKIDDWIKYTDELHQCIATETIDSFFRYFDFSKAPAPTFNELYKTGEFYNYLSQDDCKKLFSAGSKLTIEYENLFNNQVAKMKENFVKQDAAKTAKMWKEWFQEDKGVFEYIATKLKNR